MCVFLSLLCYSRSFLRRFPGIYRGFPFAGDILPTHCPFRLSVANADLDCLPQFLLEIGVVKDPADAGFYSGVTESIYAVAQLVTGSSIVLALGSLVP